MSGALDYNFLSQDNVRPISDMISKWQGVQKNALDIQQLQAQKAAGQILQQATDANGNTDYNAAARLASQAGPGVAFQMQDLLTKSAALRSAQINQGAAMYNNIARGAASIMDNASDDNLEAQRQAMLRQWPGQASAINAEFDAAKNMSEGDRKKWAYTHLNGSLDAHDQMVRSPFGQTTSADIGGTQQPLTVVQGSPYTPPSQTIGPGVTRGAPPGTFLESGHWEADGRGGRTWVPDYTPAARVQPGGQPAPGQPSTAPPPPPAGATPRIPSPGGYPSPANAPASTGSSAGGKVAPAAPGPQSQNVPPTGAGVQVASADSSFVPSSTAPAAAPSGAVASDVAAIQAGRANARATPPTGMQTAQNYPPAGTVLSSPIIQTPGGPVVQRGPPSGYTERLKQDQDQYAADQANLSNRYTNVQNLNTALDALKLTNTGRSTGAVHNFYSFLSSQGIAPGFVDNDVTQYDIARKAMMAFAASRVSGSAAGTDLARVQSELSNASPEISQAAALHVLKQNLGLENMAIAANLQHEDKSGAGYGDSKSQFYQKYDPRGFAWDAYDPDERGRMQAEAEKNGTIGKLRASVKKAMDLELVHPPARSSEAAPASNGSPAPTPANSLLPASSSSPPNALAA